jgi:hypothetical protein
MNRKIFFVVVMMGWQSLISEGVARDVAPVVPSARPNLIPQFYAGAFLGVQRLTGKRSEVAVFESAGAPLETINFANQKSFSNNNGCYAAHVGFTWNVPKTIVFFGPEIYLGRGSVTNDLKGFEIDQANGLSRSLNASVRQQTFWGGALQVGLNCHWNLRPYLLLGLEKSQFEYSGTYVPRSQAALNPIIGGPVDDYPDTLLNARKWLRGFLWGFGIEKQVHSIKIGADIRIIHYKEFKTSQLAAAFEPETLFSTFKPKNIRFGLKLSYAF